MRIASVGSAFPENLYSQKSITDALKQHWGPRLERPELLERVHSRAGVRQRYLAFPIERYAQFTTWGETNLAWMEVGEKIGEKAISAALERAALRPTDVDAIYVVSTTGIASPSLDARLVNRMGLRRDIKRTPIFGLGCVGGAVGITRAADYVRAYPKQRALLLSVELCSLTIQRNDLSAVNLISTGLFSDGAAAVVIEDGPVSSRGPEVVSSRSIFYPDTEEVMGWDISETGFEIVLSPQLPELIRTRLGADLDSFLAAHELSRRDIGSWVVHPGGPKILEAVEEALGLSGGELSVSWECLARFGNFSSGSVLRVLEDVMTVRRPATGTPGLIMAMGPGFCSELILVRW
jgi:alkylresorcinol/alkylpyrone synthase